MVRFFALLFAIGFITAGILGYMPAYVTNGKLLGIFEVDSMHNMIHLASGVIALLSIASAKYARLYFQVFGIIYGLVTLGGFITGGNLLIMHVNMADNLLHLCISVIALLLGFIV